MITLSMLSGPGGVGKTTVALLLAYIFRKRGYDVVLIDTDPSLGLSLTLLGESELSSAEHKGKTLADALEKLYEKSAGYDVEDFIKKDVDFYDVKLDIVPSSPKLSEVLGTRWYSYGASAEEPLSSFVKALGKKGIYQLAIIDSIPFYEIRYSRMACLSSEFRIIVTTPRSIDIWRTNYMIEKFKSMGIVDEDELAGRFRILMNKVPRSGSVKKITWRGDWEELGLRVVSKYGMRVFSTIIPDAEAFAIPVDKAARKGIPRFYHKNEKWEDKELGKVLEARKILDWLADEVSMWTGLKT